MSSSEYTGLLVSPKFSVLLPFAGLLSNDLYTGLLPSNDEAICILVLNKLAYYPLPNFLSFYLLQVY